MLSIVYLVLCKHRGTHRLVEINVKHATSRALAMFCLKYTTLLVVGLSLRLFLCVELRLIVLTVITLNVF